MKLQHIKNLVKENKKDLSLIVQNSEINQLDNKTLTSFNKCFKSEYYDSFQIVKQLYKPIIKIK